MADTAAHLVEHVLTEQPIRQSVDWRLSPARQGDGGFEVNLDAARRDGEGDAGAEHRIGVGITARW